MTTRNRELAGIIDDSGNITAGGNLTVSGTTTTVSSTVETHADPLIELNTGAGSNSNDLGFVFERGSTGDNACLIWDESNDVFAVGTTTATGTSTGNMSFTVAGLTAAVGTFSSLDISGNADIDGTLEADVITVDGTALNEYIADTVGAMVSSNTETNVTVTYEDGDNTLDFVVGTLNQDTTGTADNITITANNSTDETVYPIFVDGTSGSQGGESDSGLTYNPSTGVITATQFTGAVSGNASTATTATTATNVTASANNSTDETVYPTFVDGATGGQGIETDTGLTYNPSSGLLTTTLLAGTLNTAAQTNITSVGTLTSFRSTGIDDNADALAITIDSSENVGIGVTPEANWRSNCTALDIGSLVALFEGGADSTILANNIYEHTDTNRKHKASGYGSYIQQYQGNIYFTNTTSGSADATISETTRMTIAQGGNVGIGVTPVSGTKLHLHGAADENTYLHLTQGDGGATASDGLTIGMLDGGANAAIRLRENGFMQIYTNNTERMRIVAGGAVGIGTDTPTSGLTVATSANITQVALTSSSAAVAWDADAAANAYHVTTENTTFSAPSNATGGQIISVEIAQGGTARTIAWNTVFEWAASTAPTVTATASKTDIFTFRYNGSVWQEIGRVQNMAQT